MNALNTSWDLLLDKPYMDQGKPDNAWDIPGLKTAVHVNGTLNNPADTDQGWTVEIAFPWKVLAEHARHAGPPTEGEQWRIDFSRVEWQITTNGGVYKKVPTRRRTIGSGRRRAWWTCTVPKCGACCNSPAALRAKTTP